MANPNCPECKDTGIYQGLNTVEPCRACGNAIRLVNASHEIFTAPIVYMEIAEVEPVEIVFPIDSIDQVDIDVDCQITGTQRQQDTLIATVSCSKVIVTLTDIPQPRNRYHEYKQLIQGQTPFTAILQTGEDTHRKENVTMTAYLPNGTHGSFTLEWEPDDA